MTDDDLKSLLLTHSTEIRRHFDVVVERMGKQFALVSLEETFASLAARVERIESSAH